MKKSYYWFIASCIFVFLSIFEKEVIQSDSIIPIYIFGGTAAGCFIFFLFNLQDESKPPKPQGKYEGYDVEYLQIADKYYARRNGMYISGDIEVGFSLSPERSKGIARMSNSSAQDDIEAYIEWVAKDNEKIPYVKSGGTKE